MHTALCLSGGGYRAAIFHLGALLRLHQRGVLRGLHYQIQQPQGIILVAGFVEATGLIHGGGEGSGHRGFNGGSYALHPLALLTGDLAAGAQAPTGPSRRRAARSRARAAPPPR